MGREGCASASGQRSLPPASEMLALYGHGRAGEWVWRGEFVVGSGDSRCGRFVPAGAGEDELGFAI